MISRVRIHATTPEGLPPLDLTATIAREMEQTRRSYRARGRLVSEAFYDDASHGLCFVDFGDTSPYAPPNRPRLYKRRP